MDRFTYLACSQYSPATHNAAFFVDDRRAFVERACSPTGERHGTPMSEFLLSFSHRPKDHGGLFLDLTETGVMRSYFLSEVANDLYPVEVASELLIASGDLVCHAALAGTLFAALHTSLPRGPTYHQTPPRNRLHQPLNLIFDNNDSEFTAGSVNFTRD